MDPTWDGSATTYWSSVELNIGILCACLPTMRPLFKKYAPGLFGSSREESTYRLGAITSRTVRKAQTDEGICIHQEVQFQSTTELRS